MSDTAWIQTNGGGRFYPLNPTAASIEIEDIAHALSNLCRFNGHCDRFYSVAEHSFLVSRMVPPEYRLEALLHDASEAYLCDVPRPLKHLPEFARYREIETEVQAEILARFDVFPSPESIAAIHEADNRMLATEARDLMTHREIQAWSALPEPYELDLRKPLLPNDARLTFLAAFTHLKSGKFR
jgi:hypothetical protein